MEQTMLLPRVVREAVAFAIALCALQLCWGQPERDTHLPRTTDARPRFEVASVKRSEPEGRRAFAGGPGSAAPEMIRYLHATIYDLVARAFGVEFFQISGPDWLRDEHYDVIAKLAPGTSKDQFKTMLQVLL